MTTICSWRLPVSYIQLPSSSSSHLSSEWQYLKSQKCLLSAKKNVKPQSSFYIWSLASNPVQSPISLNLTWAPWVQCLTHNKALACTLFLWEHPSSICLSVQNVFVLQVSNSHEAFLKQPHLRMTFPVLGIPWWSPGVSYITLVHICLFNTCLKSQVIKYTCIHIICLLNLIQVIVLFLFSIMPCTNDTYDK